MATTASFTRHIVGHDIVFTVSRARFPLSSLLFAIFAFFLGGTIPIVNAVLFAVIIYRITKMMSSRKPLHIVLGPQTLRFESLVIPLEDLAEFSVVGPDGVAVASSSVTFVGVGPAGMAMAAAGAIAHASGRAFVHGIAFLANRAAARQLELRVRRRSHSKPIRIVDGLTKETADALLVDLTEEVQQKLRAIRAWQDTGAAQLIAGHQPGQTSMSPLHSMYHQVQPCLPPAGHEPNQSYADGRTAQTTGKPAIYAPIASSNRTVVAAVQDAPATDGRTAYAPSMASAKLRFIKGPLEGRVVPIVTGTIIGREAAVAQLVIPHPQVSSAHAWIGFEGAPLVFRDRGSTNGSSINGVPVNAGVGFHLRSGDTVSLGRDDVVSFVVEHH